MTGVQTCALPIWALFSLVGALVMGVILKCAVAEILKKPDSYYDKYEPGMKEDDNV